MEENLWMFPITFKQKRDNIQRKYIKHKLKTRIRKAGEGDFGFFTDIYQRALQEMEHYKRWID